MKSKATIHPALKAFGFYFIQDADIIFKSKEELLRFVLRHQTDAHKQALPAVLKDLLSDRYSGEESKRIWWQSSSSIVFHDATELREILRQTLRMLKGGLRVGGRGVYLGRASA